MKQFFAFFIALCAVAFSGCSEDNGETVGDLAGMWAETFDFDGEDHAVDICEIKGNKMIYRHCTNLSDILEPVYKDGTLSCDEEAIFEIYWIVNVYVSDSHLSSGEYGNLRYERVSEDKIQLWDEADLEDVMTWQRIHNTVNIVFK